MDELLENADVITLHCPLTPETEGMIHSGTIARMKQGVLLVQRFQKGPLIVEEDLSAALCSGKIGGAAVDVVSAEPICEESAAYRTHYCHYPSYCLGSREARQRLMDIAVENLVQFCKGTPQNVINV